MSSDSDKEIVVRVSNVSKRFKLYRDIVIGPIKELLFFWKRRHYYEEFLAVQDVSFQVSRGEVIGIIGPNGAGKTTLLKMIAGLLPVDAGTIEVTGKITALLALGVGVHPEMTGRENIVYGGMLLGMPKREIVQKTPSIIEFAELGDYIDHPLRTYSSGMRSRLLFSIAMSIDPDILIVDEALATGDIAFVNKCLNRIREICASGATIIFVSHNLQTIENLCTRTIVLNRGRVIVEGPVSTGISAYIATARAHGELEIEQSKLQRSLNSLGTGDIQLRDAFLRVAGQRTDTAEIGAACDIALHIEAKRDLRNVRAMVRLYSAKCPTTYAFLPPCEYFLTNPQLPLTFDLARGNAEVALRFERFTAGDGTYAGDVLFYPGDPEYKFDYETCYCYVPRVVHFQAVYRDQRYFGRGALTEIPLAGVEVRREDRCE